MINYCFKCPRCGVIEEFPHDPNEVGSAEHSCPACEVKMDRMFFSPTIKISFRAGHDPYTGQNFNSQAERDRYLAENGLIKEV